MRITVCVTGILLMVAAAVAQDDDMAAETVAQDNDMAVAAVAQDDDVVVATVAVDLNDAAIAAKVRALQKHAVVGSVRVKEARNRKTNAKAKTVTVATEQDQDDPFVGTMRLTIEMVDGTNVWYGQDQLAQQKWTRITAKGVDTGKIDYTGEDIWTFKIPFGKGTELVRPDVKAYAAEYGFVVNNKVVSNKFFVVAAKCKEVASGDEITARNQDSENVIKIRSAGQALKEGEGEEKEIGEEE